MKKAFITALLISLASHVLVLSMPIMGSKSSPQSREQGLITVRLTESTAPEPVVPEQSTPIKKAITRPGNADKKYAVSEDTIEMGSEDSRYRPYLLKVRQRIEQRWNYPPAAIQNQEKGSVTVRFSIDGNGYLAAQDIVSSTGYQILDEHTLFVIRAASPYDRLPSELKLSRLHIVATFHYRLTE